MSRMLEAKESLRVRPNVRILVIDVESGQIVRELRTHNIVTNAGLDAIARRVALIAPPEQDQFAIGTGSTAPAVTDTELVNEVYRSGISSASQGVATTTFNYLLPATVCNGETLREAAIMDYLGNVLARIVHTAQVKSNSLQVLYLWQWTFANVTA